MPRLFDNLVILKIGTKGCNRHAPDIEVDMVGELTQFLVQTLQILDRKVEKVGLIQCQLSILGRQ